MLMDSVRVGSKIITRVLYGGGGAFAERKLNQAPRPARFSATRLEKTTSACSERYGREQFVNPVAGPFKPTIVIIKTTVSFD